MSVLNLLQNQKPKEVEIDLRPGIQGPSPKDIERWLENKPEVDLGSPKRDGAIVPTTWHNAG